LLLLFLVGWHRSSTSPRTSRLQEILRDMK
jgi:hypothetical protein